MSYVNMDHAEWMQRHIDATRRVAEKFPRRRVKGNAPEKLSEFQKRVINIVGIVGGGIYNAPISKDTIDWNWGGGVSMIWKSGDLSTFDFNRLTWLVFLCHEARIRCCIEGAGPRQMRLSFWQRKADGGVSGRHPSLEEAIKSFREAFPHDRSINYREVSAEQPPSTVSTLGRDPEVLTLEIER